MKVGKFRGIEAWRTGGKVIGDMAVLKLQFFT